MMPAVVVVSKTLELGPMSDPLSILKTRRALDTLRMGEVVRVLATDPGLVLDLAAFTRRTGHTILEYYQRGSQFVFHIQKKSLLPLHNQENKRNDCNHH